MQPRSFRTAVLAATLAFQAQARVLPKGARTLGKSAGRRVMQWLDDRREKLDARILH